MLRVRARVISPLGWSQGYRPLGTDSREGGGGGGMATKMSDVGYSKTAACVIRWTTRVGINSIGVTMVERSGTGTGAGAK